ncbi:HAD-IIB family hydrolase [Acinetobacter qingfengensis]|uniref:Mannosyl-3-phosphoglycerate phosphatase n=1 Tax=Acinetobacter qingfengensis TaxID=1262585 RepID=A0A1E7REH7_9GAMM|nr:HAD-IIB family hydrolase [Acinetobacter qingfengensis]KAA8735042.1 HAD-IIB family hydrolase [Acinetobacter qingfengensis]OEY97764.1 mannosyl-3-phosphoglycerate phosphatase [Acinetobacter qingfengensis]
MLPTSLSWMIVTDLDGSLLDHDTYRWDAAQTWLDRFVIHHIPVVFCTSKTATEVQQLQMQMQLIDMPYICENGGIFYVDGEHHIVSTQQHKQDYSQIVSQLQNIREQYAWQYSGFADVEVQQIIAWTGLDSQSAMYAKQRQASEPILWQDTDENLQKFKEQLALRKLDLIKGGRFWHVMNQGSDKYHALQQLLAYYQQQNLEFRTIGLGDSPNDALFLQHTDCSVVIQSKYADRIQLDQHEHVYYTQNTGPQGWAEGLDYFLTSLREQ